MQSPERKVALYLLVLVGSLLGFSLAYWQGMNVIEGRSHSYVHSLQVVVETYTTAGYGSDAPWTTTAMNLFVILMNAASLILILLAVPVFLAPAMRDAIQQTPPTSLDESYSDHVVLATHSPRMDALLDQLDARDVDYVIVEPDPDAAMELHEAGEAVVHAEPDDEAGLEAADLRSARALVIDVADRIDASVVLTAREMDGDVRIVSVVADPDRGTYHRLAGADAVVSPRPVLGERLVEMVTAAVRADVGETVAVGDDLWLLEVPVANGSDLAGETVESAGFPDREDAHLVGAWRSGEFQGLPSAHAELLPGSVLLVVGTHEALEEVADQAAARSPGCRDSETVVVGYGEVGRAVGQGLASSELSYTVVDVEAAPGVDVVGDAQDSTVLERAGVETAQSVVLAIPDDAEREFAALVARDLNDECHLAARADDTGAVRRLYRAGADYVLSIDEVAGRMLAASVLGDQPALVDDTRIEVVSVADSGLAGRTLADCGIPETTGCSVVAIVSGDSVRTEVDGEDRLEDGDHLVVVGRDGDLSELLDSLE